MRAKITKRLVEEETATGKRKIIFDTEVAGFALQIMPSGARTYQLRYRMGGRRSQLRTYTIGKHGHLTPDQARRTAQALIGDVRKGIDPAAEKARKKAEDRSALTVEALSTEFLEVYGGTKLKPRSLEEYRRAFRSHINPRLGKIKVRDVAHGDVERLHHAMRAIPPTANRTVAALSKFFSWAIRAGYRPNRQNPCQGVEKFKERGRERYLSPAEIGALGAAIRTCEDMGEISSWQAALFRVLLLSGLRRDELRLLQWRCVDFDRSTIVLEDSKTGRRDVPIAAPVLQVLAGITRIEGNPYVFCGSRAGRPIVNLFKPWKRVLKVAGISPARVHDLRHTAASVGVSSGASLVMIGGVLGHRNPKTTSRYAHLADDPVRATSEAIAERITKALEGEQAEILPPRKC